MELTVSGLKRYQVLYLLNCKLTQSLIFRVASKGDISIDRIALAKQRNNALGSACPSVCLFVCLKIKVVGRVIQP